MNQLSQFITQIFLKKYIISKEDFDIFQYGAEVLLSSTITSTSIIVVSILLDSLKYCPLYFLILIPLKTTVGGYHAKTYISCFIISNFSYIFLIFLLKFFLRHELSPSIWLSILFICTIYIIKKAPVTNPDQPLNSKNISKNKKYSTVILLLDNILLCIIYILKYKPDVFIFCILTIFSIALFTLPVHHKLKKIIRPQIGK